MRFIISSGKSIVSQIADSIVKLTTNTEEIPLSFPTIGEAMVAADKVNSLLGTHSFKVLCLSL